jgi:hypothetical protein
MRCAAILAAALLFPASGSAQEGVRTDGVPRPPLGTAVIPIAVAKTEPHSATSGGAARGRLDEFNARIRALEARFRDDVQLQRGAIVVALGAAAVDAVRRKRSLTGVSTQALRLGLDKPLARIGQRSGLMVAPSIGYRTLAVTITRTFQ